MKAQPIFLDNMNEFVIMTKKLAISYHTPSHAQNNQGVRNAARGQFLYYKDWMIVAKVDRVLVKIAADLKLLTFVIFLTACS